MNILETNSLTKSFQMRHDELQAVKGVDLEVSEGELFGFLGPNGAGKTTTLRMLATLLSPDGGQASVVGRDLLTEPVEVRKRIGYVGQAGGADRSLTARENLAMQARLYGMSKGTSHGRVESLISTLDLHPFADRVAKTYSGGQRRRLDLALGMVHEPRLLFLDEPTTGLDPQSRARLWDEVRNLKDAGTTVFLTTHYLEEADALCDRLAIIDDGRVVARGTPEELKRQISGDVVILDFGEDAKSPSVARELLDEQTFIRGLEEHGQDLRLYVERGEESLGAILRLLDDGGVSPAAASLARPTLDDVFLEQTGRSLREPSAKGEQGRSKQSPDQPE